MRLRLLVLVGVLTLGLAVPPPGEAGRARCAGAKKRCKLVGSVKRKGAGLPRAAARPVTAAQPMSPAPAPLSVPIPPAPPGPGAVVAPPPPPPPPPPSPTADPRRLQVRADEFTLVRSQPTVAAGDVTVEFTTIDAEDPHDLAIFRTDGTGATFRFDELEPGRTATKVLRFGAGTYRLVCTLPQHEARGMSATVTAL
jgi:plastocyanin